MDAVPLAENFRVTDLDRYISILYAPAGKRAALAALYAFDAEIAGIRSRVREPLPGEIRLQWWRDAFVASEPTGNPVADALIDVIRLHDLPMPAFVAYLEARILDLYDDPMPSRNDLEGYLGETEGALIQLAALVLDPQAGTSHGALAGHAGCARGIARILETLPIWRARGQCLVPADLLDAAGTTPGDFVARRSEAGEARAVQAMTALAGEHLAAFRNAAKALPAALRPAYLPVSTVHMRLASASVAPWRLQWLSFRAAMGFWPKS